MRPLLTLLLSLLALGASAGAPMQPGLTIVDTVPAGCSYANLHVRAQPKTRKAARWGLVWDRRDSLNYCAATLRLPSASDVSDVYANTVVVDVVSVVDGVEHTVMKKSLSSGIAVDGRHNSFKLVCDAFGARLYVGEQTQQRVGEVSFSGGAMGIVSDSPLDVERADAVWRATADLGSFPLPDIERRAASSADPVEGVYTYLDRDIDLRHATLGGRYRLACLRSGDGTYSLIYLGGADSATSDWTPGRVKAVLSPTPFQGNYDMLWLAADGTLVDEDANAQFVDDFSILTLRFPLQGSQLRLRRL